MTKQLAEGAVSTVAKRFIVYCVEITSKKRVTQQDIATLANKSQPSISAIMNGRVVASKTRYAALDALNQLRKANGLDVVNYDEVIWTWED